MKALQTLGLVLIGILLCVLAVFVSNKSSYSNVQIILPTIIAYASYISVLLLGDKNKIFKSITQFLWDLLFDNKVKLIALNAILSVLSTVLITKIISDYNKGRYNAYLKVLNNNEIVEEVEEEVRLFNVLAQEDIKLSFSEDGIARVSIDIPGIYQVTYGNYRFPDQKISSTLHQFLVHIDDIRTKAELIRDNDVIQKIELLKLPKNYLDILAESFIPFPESKTSVRDLLIHGISSEASFYRRNNYAVNYNHLFKIPNCVVYKMYGEKKRFERPLFYKDTILNSANPESYRGTGYDRGHLVSLSDMSFFNSEALKEANLMSVITPQAKDLNRGTWSNIERYTRNFVKDTVFIIAGSIFAERDSLDNVSFVAVGEEKIAVPSHFYRIISRRKENKIFTNSFIVPNRNDLSRDIENYLTSIDSIENLSGLDFFPEMADSLEVEFEKKIYELWN